jgi:hypothetical protein
MNVYNGVRAKARATFINTLMKSDGRLSKAYLKQRFLSGIGRVMIRKIKNVIEGIESDGQYQRNRRLTCCIYFFNKEVAVPIN